MIDTPDKLAELVERAIQSGGVGLDTEFRWERTYYPQLGLVQVALADGSCHLVDTLAVRDLRPFGKLLADPTVEKVFHDSEQDLMILRRLGGARPRRIFDTQHSAGFCGQSCTISLQDALRAFGLAELEKTETRTDWLRRPLSDEQLAYAKDDVRYLLPLRDALLAHARARGRDAWMREELDRYEDPEIYEERDASKQYRRIKGAQGLTARGLAVLRDVARWREEEARRLDRTRGHVVSDALLVALARHRPRSLAAMQNLEGPYQRSIRRHHAALLAAVARGLALPLRECPKPPRRPPRKQDLKARADAALKFVREKCAEAAMDPLLLTSRAHVTALIGAAHLEHMRDHPLLNGWRKVFLGEGFVELLA